MQELNYASLRKRFEAHIIDSLILAVFTVPMTFLLRGHLILFIYLIPLIYYTVFEGSRKQATIGKIVLRIEVTDSRGSRCSYSRAFLRSLAMMGISYTAAYLLILFSYVSGVEVSYIVISSVRVLAFIIDCLAVNYTSRLQAGHDIIADCLVLDSSKKSLINESTEEALEEYHLV